MSRLTRALIVLAPASLLLAGCSRTAGPEPPRNVIFILVDTLRADHLGAYGYARDTSPSLDAFARGSVFFRDARSQASCTFPSVNSILTSRYPSAFLGQPPPSPLGIPKSIPSIAEILRERGFRTAAVSASRWRPWLRWRSSTALRICASFFTPMPAIARIRPARAAAARSSRLATPSVA